jgi:hypothetical protein
MTKDRRYIGDSLREAIDWAQDTLRTTRPIAEQTIMSAIAAKTVVWDDGVFLLEDDEDMERRKISSVQSTQKSFNAAKKWTRIHFRNHNRARGSKGKGTGGKNSLSSVHKQAAGKFSDVGDAMASGGSPPPASMPSSSTIEENNEG